MTSLPPLPSSLKLLNCSYNKLTSLPPTLPESLRDLYCSNNQLTSLPPTLPNSLRDLNCSYNQLTSLPDTLPNYLRVINCSNNQLISLPDTLPNSLQHFWYNNNPELIKTYPFLDNTFDIPIQEIINKVNIKNKETNIRLTIGSNLKRNKRDKYNISSLVPVPYENIPSSIPDKTTSNAFNAVSGNEELMKQIHSYLGGKTKRRKTKKRKTKRIRKYL